MLTTTTREMQEILANDPLVGDTACQNHAVYLAYLARKVRRNKPLTPTELEFIENCRELTEAKDTSRNEFGIITRQQSKKLEKLDAVAFPENINSNNAKNKYLAEKKRSVAEQSLAFLIRKTQGMTFFAPLAPAMLAGSSLAINSVNVPIMPFYTNLKMMLNIVDRKAIDIVALFTCVQSDGDDRVMLGKARVLYTKRNGLYQAVPLRDAEEEPERIKEAIKVEFVSNVKPGEAIPSDRADPLVQFNRLLANFMENDILKLILLYGGNHDGYPSRTKIIGGGVFQQTPVAIPGVQLYDIDCCSLYEYAELKRLADEAGISRDSNYIDHVSVTSRPL